MVKAAMKGTPYVCNSKLVTQFPGVSSCHHWYLWSLYLLIGCLLDRALRAIGPGNSDLFTLPITIEVIVFNICKLSTCPRYTKITKLKKMKDLTFIDADEETLRQSKCPPVRDCIGGGLIDPMILSVPLSPFSFASWSLPRSISTIKNLFLFCSAITHPGRIK